MSPTSRPTPGPTFRSGHSDLCLYAGRRCRQSTRKPGPISSFLPFGKGYRQEERVLPGSVQCRPDRSHALGSPAYSQASTPAPTRWRSIAPGFRPFTMMAAEDGSFGYEMEIITYPDSGIEKVEDIKGKTMAFTSETSNSGFKAPSALLKGRIQHGRRHRFRACLLRQARQLDPRRRQQGLPRRSGRQLGDGPR